MNPPIKRRRGAASGLLLVLLGAWGGLIPFVGPYFNYQIGTTSTWDWSADRLYLYVLPAVATVLGGLMLLGASRRMTASLGAVLALAGGLWFIGGPVVSELWNHGVLATGQAFGDTGTRVLEWLGFHYALGAAITLLSAFTLGFMAALPVTDEVTTPAAAPVPGEGQRTTTAAPRRGFLRRRGKTPERETTPQRG